MCEISRYGEQVTETGPQVEHLGRIHAGWYKRLNRPAVTLLHLLPPSHSFGWCYGIVSAIHPCFEGHSPSVARFVVFHMGTQPHPTEVSWQKAITSFSQSAEDKSRMRPDDKRGPAFTAQDRNEDVFGPIDFLCADNKKDVGAIGDGRKRASPDTVNNVNSIFCILFVDVGS